MTERADVAAVLAALIDEPKRVTPAHMDFWVAEFDSWDLCDQVTSSSRAHRMSRRR